MKLKINDSYRREDFDKTVTEEIYVTIPKDVTEEIFKNAGEYPPTDPYGDKNKNFVFGEIQYFFSKEKDAFSLDEAIVFAVYDQYDEASVGETFVIAPDSFVSEKILDWLMSYISDPDKTSREFEKEDDR